MAPCWPERWWGGRQGAKKLVCPQPALSLYPITPALALINGVTVQMHTHTETGPWPITPWLKGQKDIVFLPFTLPKEKEKKMEKNKIYIKKHFLKQRMECFLYSVWQVFLLFIILLWKQHWNSHYNNAKLSTACQSKHAHFLFWLFIPIHSLLFDLL